MAIFLLHAARDEAPAEALARACERRGLFVEVETGRRATRAFKPEDHCIALLSLAESLDSLAPARRRRAFEACTQAKLSLLLLEDGLRLPFGWRDLQRLAPPELGGAWSELALTLQADPQPVMVAPTGKGETLSAVLPAGQKQFSPPRRRVVLITCKSTLAEAESLSEALMVRSQRGVIAPADALGPQIGAMLAEIDIAVFLLSAEAGASDGMRRWLHGAARAGIPMLGVMVDALWLQAPLADHLERIIVLPLHRLPGDRRGAQLAARCRALPRRRKSQGRA